MRRPPRIALLLVAPLALVACSGGDDSGGAGLSSASSVSSVSTDASPTSTSTTTTVARTTTTGAPTTTSTTSSSSSTSTTVIASTTTALTEIPLALTADGIGNALFGSDPDGVVAYLTSAFGSPNSDSGWVDPFSQFGTCPGTEVRGVVWGDLTLLFGDASWKRDDATRHFFAYHYGPPAADSLRPPGLVTDQGIGVGSSIAELRAAYPQVDIRLGEEGIAPPSFYVNDLVNGFVTGDDDTDSVTSILGGIGCGE